MSLNELTKIYDSKGIDGLSRVDRIKSGYNRGDFLFEKYLKQKKETHEKPKIQLTHENIIKLGASSFSKFKESIQKYTDETPKNCLKILQDEIERIETEANDFQIGMEIIFEKQLAKERISIKKVNYSIIFASSLENKI